MSTSALQNLVESLPRIVEAVMAANRVPAPCQCPYFRNAVHAEFAAALDGVDRPIFAPDVAQNLAVQKHRDEGAGGEPPLVRLQSTYTQLAYVCRFSKAVPQTR